MFKTLLESGVTVAVTINGTPFAAPAGCTAAAAMLLARFPPMLFTTAVVVGSLLCMICLAQYVLCK